MKKSLVSLCAAILLLGGMVQKTNAVEITFNFEGIVTSVDEELEAFFDTTQTISGSYTFESTTPDTTHTTDPDPLPTVGRYDGALVALSFAIDGYTATSAVPSGKQRIRVDDPVLGSTIDMYGVTDWSGFFPSVGGRDPMYFGIIMEDDTGVVFSDDGLPLALDLSHFTSATWGLTFGPEELEVVVSGNITSLAAPIPEPASILLLGSGLIGLAGYGRKKFFKK